MIYYGASEREKRFELFNYLSARVLLNSEEWTLSPDEWRDWYWLRLFFFEEYVQSRLKPWRKQFK